MSTDHTKNAVTGVNSAVLGPRHKKLLFRAWHRGTREADLMVGRFAQEYVPHWDETRLDIFEDFLAESDADIFDWISGRQELPVLPCRIILQEMQAFYQTRNGDE